MFKCLWGNEDVVIKWLRKQVTEECISCGEPYISVFIKYQP